MIFSKVISILSKNKGSIVYVLIVIGLWTLAALDISKIIIDYIEDNRYTYVKTETVVDNNIPFLEDMEFCVDYNVSLFEQRWYNETDTDDYQSPGWMNMSTAPELLASIDFSKIDKNGILNLSKKQMFFAAKYLHHILRLDDRFLHAGVKTLPDDYRNWKSTPIVDVGLATRGQLEILQNSFQHWILGSFHNYPYVNVTFFTYYSVCFYFQTKKAFAAMTKEKLILPFGIIHPNKDAAAHAMSKTGIIITGVYPAGDTFSTSGHDASSTKTINIRTTLKNFGIYDKDEAADDCYREGDFAGGLLPLQTAAQNEWPNCKARIYVRALQEFCRCTPFSLKSLSLIDESEKDALGFCTFEIYNSTCFDQLRKYLSKKPCLDECVRTKNYYRFDRFGIHEYPTPSMPSDLEPNGWYSQTRITVYIEDPAFLVYREKFKLSFAQLIAQVGGDIGLYTGFSLLALWQFFCFLFHHQEHKKQQKAAAAAAATAVVAEKKSESLIDVILCYLETRGCQYDKNERIEKETKEKEFKETKEKFEKRFEDEQQERGKLEKELKHLNDQIRELIGKNDKKEK